MRDVDAMVLCDMPGGDPGSGEGCQVDPSAATRQGSPSMSEVGVSIVALHHAIADGSTPPDHAEALGAALFLIPRLLCGSQVMDGGTRASLTMTITADDRRR